MTGRKQATIVEILRDRIGTGLHVRRLTGRERLPNTRTLAAELEVNERVILGALKNLANEGFVMLRERSGAYVLPPRPASSGVLPDLGAWMVSDHLLPSHSTPINLDHAKERKVEASGESVASSRHRAGERDRDHEKRWGRQERQGGVAEYIQRSLAPAPAAGN